MPGYETPALSISNLTGLKKAAILLVAMGEDASSKIFKEFTDSEVELLTKEISLMNNVPADVISEVTEEFYNMVLAQNYIAAGGPGYAKKILEAALDKEKAIEVLKKVQRSLEVKGFNVLKDVDSTQLLAFIQKEHPQTIALVLTQIEVEQAASILSDLPNDLREDVMYRFATMDTVPQDMVTEIEKILESRIDFGQGGSKLGGVKTTAEILNMVGRSVEKNILEGLSKSDPELATEIKNLMFVFEDVIILDDRSIQRVLKEVDSKELAFALKAVSEEVKLKILSNMSERAAQMVNEEMEYMGPVRLREVEEAQQRIVESIRQLEDEGEIVINMGTKGEEIVA